jgi:hypothetical protein
MRFVTTLRRRVGPPLTACVLSGLALMGCSQSTERSGAAAPAADAASPSGPTTAQSGASASSAPTSPSVSGTATPSRDPGAGVPPGGGGTAGTGQIGQTPVSYPSGITLGVASAVQYTPSATAVGTVAGHTGVVLTVRVTNGSTRPLDARYLTVALRTGADLTQAAQIFDAGNGYGSGLTGTIAAGKTARAKYAFDLPASDLSRLSVAITPDLRSPRSAVFTGAATAPAAGSEAPTASTS